MIGKLRPLSSTAAHACRSNFHGGLTADFGVDAASLHHATRAACAHGPEPTLAVTDDTASRLHRSGHSCTSRHFDGPKVCSADIAAQCCCSDTHRGCSTKSLVGSRRCRAGSPKRSSSTAKSVETQTGHSPRRRQMSDMRTKRPDAWSVSYARGSAPGNSAQPSNLHTFRRAPYLRLTCGLA